MVQIAEQMQLYVPGWKSYFRLAQTPLTFKDWTSGPDSDFELSSSSTGARDRPFTVGSAGLVLPTNWPRK
jgi:hypothetical protein